MIIRNRLLFIRQNLPTCSNGYARLNSALIADPPRVRASARMLVTNHDSQRADGDRYLPTTSHYLFYHHPNLYFPTHRTRRFVGQNNPRSGLSLIKTRTMSTQKPPKTATEMYQRLSQLEHVLKRPDTYIGSVEFHESQLWVCDAEGKMHHKTVKVVPGLYKIFDEILVNAADNKVNDSNMKNLKVELDKENNTISVFNDGRGIPIEMHEHEKMYVPELIFGNLLTSSNYNDEEQKVTGGRNGFGAKLCNIFSTEFTLETCNGKQLYKQVWHDNMGKVDPPEITRTNSKSYTKVTFKPDLARFGMSELDDDLLGVLRRRVWDVAGTVKGITVTLNGENVPIKTFKGYIETLVNSMSDEGYVEKPKILYASPNDRWEVGFSLSDGNGFQQMSFVNSIATTSGGTHVDYIADQISKYVVETASKGSKIGKLQKAQVKNNMFVFVNCKINNPGFSSQTKEQLITKISQFGSKCQLTDKFVKDCYKATGLDDRLTSISERNASKEMRKQDGGRKQRLTSYPKLVDAAKAGTKESHKCTLILCEGDSAAGAAENGLTVVGYEYYGIFPLKGKILNVRDASHDQVMKNAEIKALKQIIGLQHKKEYDSVKELRYGHVMLMTDQDHDGSHIKGLLINFFESSFPGLLDIPGFLREFITPIVKVTIESGRRKNETIPFFSMPEFDHWRDTEAPHINKWRLKYYKGLGTSEPKEMKEYFADVPTHDKQFQPLQGNDKENIELVFSKTKADERKTWLQGYQPGTYLDQSVNSIPITDFINKELIIFSMADNLRSIPSVVDGLKPGQRKIMWVSLERVRKEVKVQSLAGIVTMRAAYHHGEAALCQTIVGLAQDFVGANNIYWLLPIGAFGSRSRGGKDAASARYISTNVTPISHTVFSKDDAPILNYMLDDETTVEPEYFVPILPTLLVNGTEGIGTGWSTTIPPYNPADIVDNLFRMMDNKPLKPMTPHFRGWNGLIEKIPNSEHQWRVCGKIEEVDDETLAVTELPVKMWNLQYKEFLGKCTIGNFRQVEGASDKEKERLANGEFILESTEDHKSDHLRFVIKLPKDQMEKAKQNGLYNTFKLITNLSTSNMVAFDPQGRLRKYNTPEDILKEFYHVRLDFYRKRREYAIEQLKYELELISQRARFIKVIIIDNQLTLSNRKKKDVEADLRDLKFPLFVGAGGKPYWPDELSPEVKAEVLNSTDNPEDDQPEVDQGGIDDGDNSVKVKAKPPSYDYLLTMHIMSLTRERYEKLLKDRGDAEDRLNTLLATGIKDMWKTELNKFLEDYDKFLENDKKQRLDDVVVPSKGAGKKNAKRRAASSQDGSKRLKYEEGMYIEPPPIEEVVAKTRSAPRVKKEDSASSRASTPSGESTSKKPNAKSKVVKPEIDASQKSPPQAESSSSTASLSEASAKPSTKSKASTKPKPAARNNKKSIVVDDDELSSEGGESDDDDLFMLSD